MLISLLHPSRSRCTKSLQTTKLWKQKAGSVNYEMIISLDSDDPQLQCYLTHYPNALVGDNGSAVNAINAAARIARGDVLIVLSDDTECPDQWTDKIAHAVAGEKDCVIKVYDGVQQWIVTMPVLTRDYFMSQACGNGQYIYYPDYRHMFCDTEFTHVADSLGKIIQRHDLVFPHKHYSVLHQQPDDLHRRNDRTWNQGKEIYLRRFREQFGIVGLDPWRLSDEQHKEWLKINNV